MARHNTPPPVDADLQLELRERRKELRCIYDVFRETENADRPLDEMLRAVVARLPEAWLHADQAAARIRYAGRDYATPNFKDTSWQQTAVFARDEGGEVTVGYLSEYPEQAEGPFLAEERDLIDTVASRLGRCITLRESLQHSGRRDAAFSAIVEQAGYSIAMFEPRAARFVEFNDTACLSLGYTREEFANLALFDIDPAMTPELLAEPWVRALAQAGTLERTHRRKDGSLVDVRISARTCVLGGVEYEALVWSDITMWKRAERDLLRANVHLRGIGDANRAIVFAQSEDAVYQGVCDAIVRSGGYRLAWVGKADSDEGATVRPVAHAGAAERYIESIEVSWSGNMPTGRGPAGRAIREQQAVAIRNIAADPAFLPWRAPAAEHGFGSTVALPILRGAEHAGGALCVYSAAPDAFDENEVGHLQGLADALSFGIIALRDRAAADAARAELQASAGRLEHLMAASPAIIYRLRQVKGRWVSTEVSDNVSRILGYSADEALQPSWWNDHIYPYDRAKALENFQRVQQNDRVTHEYRFAHKDGRYLWIHDDIRVERDADGNPVSLIGAWADVTERIDAEQQVRKLSAAIEQSPNSVIITDLEARIEYVNEAFVQKTGYSREEVYGKNPKFLQSGQTPRSTYQQFWAALTNREPWRGEFVNRAKDGTLQVERAIVVPLRQTDGRVSHYVAVKEDITEQKQIEEQLRQLYLAVEQSPESIVITDLDARIQYVNEAFTRHSGYSREEVLGQNPRVLQSDKTPRATYEAMWASLQHGEPWKGEFQNRRKDGSEYTEFAIVAPIRQPDGRITHYLAIKDDITHKKAVAAELDSYRHHLEELVESRTAELAAARQRAEAANVAKSSFLANMSHEIRTPMNAIIGLTHLLRNSTTTPEQAARLEKIDASARHLLSIVNDILDLSKIEAGRMTLERVEMDLQEIVRESFVGAVVPAEEKGVSTTFEVAAGVPHRVMGDPVRLKQILLNLCGNAAKFTERGSITLRVTAVSESAGTHDVRFEITDTGVGLTEDQVSRLFMPFEQADASTTRKFGGTGLGLAITRRLVDAMGGTIGAYGTPGAGSTFWFSIPLQQSSGAAVPATVVAPPSAAERPASDVRILLVEDNPINQEVAQQILQDGGYRVEIASDGFAALAMAERAAYDVVLTDIQMPGIDGLETARRLRARSAYASTPIIAMTANVFSDDREACFAAGMNDFIGKPVDPKRLLDTVYRWTGAAPVAATDQPRAETEVENRLKNIQGLDLAAGLRSVQGRAASLERLLRSFASNRQSDVSKIREAIAEARMDDAVRLAHTLKGLGGTVGALAVSTAAQRVEAILRAPAGDRTVLATELDTLEAALKSIVAAVNAALTPSAAGPAGQVDWQQARAVITELTRLLERDDSRATKVLSDHDAMLRAALGAEGETLATLVGSFEFDKALELLKQAVAQHPKLAAPPA